MSNKDLIFSFIQTAENTQKDLKKKYNDLWMSPGERALIGKSENSEPVKVQ
mgnify:CR=1 FL=1